MSDSTMFDVVERLRLKYNLRQTDVADLCGLSRNIMGTWKTRGMLSRSIPILSDTFFWSQDYLYGNSNVLWRYDVLIAREELRKWLREQDFSMMTTARRFVAVWEKWQTLLPMREEIWAVFTYMVETVTGDVYNPISYSQWYACKQNDYQPGRMQIDGAEALTGIPLRWWYTGNPLLLADFTSDELTQLRRITLERGLKPDDAESAVNAMFGTDK